MPLCTTARPLYTRSTNIFGASISEETMHPNPRCARASARSRARWPRCWPPRRAAGRRPGTALLCRCFLLRIPSSIHPAPIRIQKWCVVHSTRCGARRRERCGTWRSTTRSRRRSARVGRGRIAALYVPPLVHFIPGSLTHLAPLFLRRQRARTLGAAAGALEGLVELCDAAESDEVRPTVPGGRGRGVCAPARDNSRSAKGPGGQNQGFPEGFRRALVGLERVSGVLKGVRRGP